MLCARQAAIPIKSYSPELMVSPVYDADAFSTTPDGREQDELITRMTDQVKDMFSRTNVLLIGPGLGRSSPLLRGVGEIMRAAKEKEMPMVVDADGLYLIAQRPDLITGAKNTVRLSE